MSPVIDEEEIPDTSI